MTTTGPTLNPQVLGLAENAHRAILIRLLDGTGLTYPLWVVLSVAAFAGGVVDRELIVGRVTTALKMETDEVLVAIDSLAASGLVTLPSGDELRLELTEAGSALFRDVRGKVDEIVDRLYSGISTEDLSTAGRVLTLVTQRANAELVALPKRAPQPA